MSKIKVDGKGKRFDTGKTRVDLLPGDAMLAIGHVYRKGALRYDERNWEKGMPWSKVIGPLLRHTFKFMMGHDYDDGPGGTGLLHSSIIAWNGIALLTYQLRKIGIDDRNKIACARKPERDK